MSDKKYYKDYSSGMTASIQEHRNGTAILTTVKPANGKRTRGTYKNKKSAYSAWYRMCN